EEQLHLYGQAEIRRAGTVLKGDRITYTQATDEVQAEGNAKISRLGATFSGPSMRFKITPRTGAMNDAEYEYAPRNLRGCAKNIRFMSGDTTTFDEAKITTCKRDDEAWFITMNKLEIDEYDQTASGTGAVLNFMGLPIIGTPWFAFPISQERRSGFLVPTYGMSSTRGLDLTIPYYFNIAPNYDLTLTPRVMSKRGVMLDTQARFLYNDFSTVVDYSYLPDDRITKENRSSVHVDSQYRKDRLSARVNYNRVSDDDFITDFSGNIRESSETVLPQDYSVRYDETYWNTAINVQKNQTLDVNGIHSTKPYERVPQIVFNGYNGNWNGFELNTTLDATRFESPYMVNGDRFVFEQSAAYPFRGAGWFVVPKATFLGTWYQLRD
ncbi:Organic solvent tolerance protein OstA, partial [gut metagenome]